MPHSPVLLSEVTGMAQAVGAKFVADLTFGRGGHSCAILNELGESKVLGVDRDIDAINYGKGEFSDLVDSSRLKLIHENFHNSAECGHAFDQFSPDGLLDFILVDLGVSSPQLDEAERGFSFYHDGPLDMRMDQSQELTAGTIVNEWNSQELIDLFKELGEIRSPSRVVNKIIDTRKSEKFKSTTQLANLIAAVEGWRKKGHHPATKFFLALRLRINNELEPLNDLIPFLVKRLSDGGRLAVITFHSTEDRIVKWSMRGLTEFGFLVNKKVIVPTREEQIKNPRSRSAKLRVFQKGDKNEKQ